MCFSGVSSSWFAIISKFLGVEDLKSVNIKIDLLPLLAYARVRYDKETTKWSSFLGIITKLSETAVDYFTAKSP